VTALKAEAGYPHTLPVRVSPEWMVTQAPRSLLDEVIAARNQQLDAKKYMRAPVPYYIVDDILRKEVKKAPREGVVYTVFILNLPAHPSGYYYVDSSVGSACSTSSWVSEGSDRVIWIDLAAGPIERGAATSGDGAVTPAHIPFISDYVKAGYVEIHDLILSLSDWLRKTVSHVILPSLNHYPLLPFRTRYIKFVVIRDGRNRRPKFSTDLIKEQIRSIAALPGQDLTILPDHEESLETCDGCAMALAQSLKRHTSTFEVGGDLQIRMHPYLDSNELRRWLEDFEKRNPILLSGTTSKPAKSPPLVWGFGRRLRGPESDKPDVIPIYIFDLSGYDLLLLDRFHQALPFPDRVIAVQTESSRISLTSSA
jgi:hypothetical protein